MSCSCPLCQSVAHTDVTATDKRRYYLCGNCSLIFVDPCHYLSYEQEKARYVNHQNSESDSGYVSFLNRLLEPMLSYLDGTMRGLDYGCGPGPTLSRLLMRHGVACDNYDPLFFDNPCAGPYDFITATECFEHFYSPSAEILKLKGLLRSGGLLGVMTEFWQSIELFEKWYYPQDPTHVVFYNQRTIDYIAGQYGFEQIWTDNRRVVILRSKYTHSV